jgi:hypothetical protein
MKRSETKGVNRVSARLVTVLTILVLLITKSVAWGSISESRLVVSGNLVVSSAFDLSVDLNSLGGRKSRFEELLRTGYMDLEGTARDLTVDSDNNSTRKEITSSRVQTSMVSFLFGELFTGVDIYSELKEVSDRLSGGSNSSTRTASKSSGGSWNLNLTVRAADMGVKTTFSSGETDFGMARMGDDEMASASLEIRF